MTGTHMKRGSFGLFPLGVRLVYYCPVKNEKVTLKADVENGCPICGKHIDWTEA